MASRDRWSPCSRRKRRSTQDQPVAGGRRSRCGTRMRFSIMLGTPLGNEGTTAHTSSQATPLFGQGHRLPTGAAWQTCGRCSRRRSRWCHAGSVVLPGATLRPGGLILLLVRLLTPESAAELPLAFTIEYPANRLAAGGTAVAWLVATQLWGRLMAPWPVAQNRGKNFCCVTMRCRNLDRLGWLRRRYGTLTVRRSAWACWTLTASSSRRLACRLAACQRRSRRKHSESWQ